MVQHGPEWFRTCPKWSKRVEKIQYGSNWSKFV
jgi:hypothetical protein